MPRSVTNDTTELAKERNRAAAERTLISWIQNSIPLVGLGSAFERIFNSIEQAFPQSHSITSQPWIYLVSLSAILLGVLLLILAIIAYRREVKSLSQDDYLSMSLLSYQPVIVSAIVLYGLITATTIFVALQASGV